MPTTFYRITFLNDSGSWEYSRLFQTVRGARAWARYLKRQSYVRDVAIWRGEPGGERVSF